MIPICRYALVVLSRPTRLHLERRPATLHCVVRVAYVRDDLINTEAVVIEDQASGDAIEIQRAIEFDDQDAALGMDTYCLVRGGASHYGGITRWIVLPNILQLELEEAAATDLELPATVVIPIDEPGADLLRKHLPALCPPSE